MTREIGAVMAILSKDEFHTVTVGGVDLRMHDPYVLVSSQRFVIGWQSSEKPLHQAIKRRSRAMSLA
jgi:hypothetical protein